MVTGVSMTASDSTHDIARVTFALLAIGLLLAVSFWVLRPFLPALIWSTMIVISSWPLMRAAQRRLFGRRWAAVIVMTVALLLVLIVPLFVALSTVINNFDKMSEFGQSVVANGVPHPPAWLSDVPVVGSRLSGRWEHAATEGREEALSKLAPYLGQFFSWLISQVGGLGMLFVHFLLTVIITAILYTSGELAARGVIAFAKRLADDRGEQAMILAAQAIRAVALGVVVTAVIQSALAALGLFVAGVPYVGILASVIFLLTVIQIGAGPVLILAIIWLYGHSSTFTASAFLVWSIFVMVVDNLVRPLLIKAGADLPLLLIFAGVIGGLVSFGIIGLFIGPVVLAISFTLMKAWVLESSANQKAA